MIHPGLVLEPVDTYEECIPCQFCHVLVLKLGDGYLRLRMLSVQSKGAQRSSFESFDYLMTDIHSVQISDYLSNPRNVEHVCYASLQGKTTFLVLQVVPARRMENVGIQGHCCSQGAASVSQISGFSKKCPGTWPCFGVRRPDSRMTNENKPMLNPNSYGIHRTLTWNVGILRNLLGTFTWNPYLEFRNLLECPGTFTWNPYIHGTNLAEPCGMTVPECPKLVLWLRPRSFQLLGKYY